MTTKQNILAADEPRQGYLTDTMKKVIRGIYARQGFYSALNFAIKAGLVYSKDQEEAEEYIRSIINEH